MVHTDGSLILVHTGSHIHNGSFTHYEGGAPIKSKGDPLKTKKTKFRKKVSQRRKN